MKVNCKAEIVKIEQLKEDIYKFSVKADEMVKQAKPRTFYWNSSSRWYWAIIKKTN